MSINRTVRAATPLALFAFLLSMAGTIAATPAAGAPTDKLDKLLAGAAAAKTAANTAAALKGVTDELARAADEIKKQGGDPADALSGRSSMVEALQKSVELEAASNAVEALRLLVRATNLSSGTAATEPAGADGRHSLDAVTDALYQRVVRIGAGDENATGAWTVKSGERLIYRLYFVSQGKLVAAELVGDDTSKKADWRQQNLTPASAGLHPAISKLGGAPKTALKAKRPDVPFALLFEGPASGRSLAALSEVVGPLASGGVLPIAIEKASSLEPVTGLPAISEVTLGSSPNGSCQLVYVPSGEILRTWKGAPTEDIRSDALSVASEVAGDLGVELTPLDPTMFGRVADVLPESKTPQYFAVTARRTALLSSGEGVQPIEPWFALYQTGRMEPNWGEYGINGLEARVWLRTTELGPYIEYPESLQSPSIGAKFSEALGLSGPAAQKLVSKAAALRARPFPEADALSNLAQGTQALVLFEQTASEKEPAKMLWAFVRVKEGLGWVPLKLLAELPKKEEPVTDGKKAGKQQAEPAPLHLLPGTAEP